MQEPCSHQVPGPKVSELQPGAGGRPHSSGDPQSQVGPVVELIDCRTSLGGAAVDGVPDLRTVDHQAFLNLDACLL